MSRSWLGRKNICVLILLYLFQFRPTQAVLYFHCNKLGLSGNTESFKQLWKWDDSVSINLWGFHGKKKGNLWRGMCFMWNWFDLAQMFPAALYHSSSIRAKPKSLKTQIKISVIKEPLFSSMHFLQDLASNQPNIRYLGSAKASSVCIDPKKKPASYFKSYGYSRFW